MEGAKIVVATDLSENVRPAAEAARGLGNMLGLDVEVAHVFDLSQRGSKKKLKIFHDSSLREKAVQRVAAWYEDAGGESARWVTVLAGDPAPELRAMVAEDDDVACLVLAMSGRGAWNRLIFGSTAAKVAGRPPCVTMVVHPDFHRIKEGITIGLGTDFEPSSDVALREAVWLARRFDAGLRIVHTNVLPSTTVIHEGELPEGMATTEIIEWAEDSMEAWLARHEGLLKGIDYEAHIVADHPVAGLRSFVEDHGIDWMVLGDRRPDERQGASTVKGKWVREMNCSTILVPS